MELVKNPAEVQRVEMRLLTRDEVELILDDRSF
jgi:hypothetical protein